MIFFLIFVLYRVVSLCMSPINDSFMSGSLDHSVRIWDLRVNSCQVSFSFYKLNAKYKLRCKQKHLGFSFPRWVKDSYWKTTYQKRKKINWCIGICGARNIIISLHLAGLDLISSWKFIQHLWSSSQFWNLLTFYCNCFLNFARQSLTNLVYIFQARKFLRLFNKPSPNLSKL